MSTCSKASLLLPFSQIAVGAELGVGGQRRSCRFRPTFPFDEVSDPALSQRGGLCHVVSHCLRDTWTGRDKGHGFVFKFMTYNHRVTWLTLERSSPFKEDLASAANSWMPADFRESAGDFPDFGIISISSNFTCKKRVRF